jgi:OFA family oxalate/formate antiporter-like MFS transporter
MTRPYLALSALSLLFFVITAGSFTSLGVVLPEMVVQLHWDWSQAGLGYTVLGVACGLASLAPALVIRRLGVRASLFLGGVLMAAGLIGFAHAATTARYLLGAASLGVGFALLATIPATYVLSRLFKHLSAAFGLYFTAGGLGAAAGPLLYTLAKSAGLDWRGYWTALAILTLAAASLAAALCSVPAEEATPAADTHETSEGWSVKAALATPTFWIITAAYTAYLLCETSVNGLSVAHLTGRGIAPAVAGGMLSLQALVNAMARAAGGGLGERIKPRTLVIAALALTAGGIAALALARGYPLMIVYVLGVGIGYGVSYLATTVLLLDTFGRKKNLELFSIMCLVSTLAAAGPWIGGALKDRTGGFEGAFWLFAGVAAIAFVAVLLMPTRPKPQLT